LENAIVRREILDTYLEGRQWCSECSKSNVHALRTFVVCGDQDVEVLGRARVPVESVGQAKKKRRAA
jgi:hypothetical protein